MFRALKDIVLYTVIGLAGIAGPAVIPSFSPVYAQEQKEEPKKEQTLEDKISDAIQRLETLETKTPKDYLRLVDIHYNFRFDKDKIISIINEAVCSLEKGQSEYKYLEAIRLLLSEKKEDAYKLAEAFLKDPTATPRLKANLSILLYPNAPEKALDLDSSHMPAIIGLFRDAYKIEITSFEGIGWKAQSTAWNELWTQQVQELLAKKYKLKYNAAVASNVEQPEKFFYLNDLHRAYAEFLKHVNERVKDRHYDHKYKHIYMGSFAEKFTKNLIKEIKDCYLKAIKADPSYYQNYIDLGDMVKTEALHKNALEHYETAYCLLKAIYDNPKTKDEEKRKLKLKLGTVCCKKGECLQSLMWGFTEVSRNVLKEYFHEDQAEEAIKEYTEARNYYESIDEKDRTAEENAMISSARDGIYSVKSRKSIWEKEHPKKK